MKNTLLLSLACEYVKEGLTKVMLRTVDTDALVIAISVAENININEKIFSHTRDREPRTAKVSRIVILSHVIRVRLNCSL